MAKALTATYLNREGLNTFVAVGSVFSMTLTFFHPVMWLPVAIFAGLTLLILAQILATGVESEPPSLIFALIWLVTTLLLASAYGALEGFFNISQVAFLILGILLGYLISITYSATWTAWLPFLLFTAYFIAMMVLGHDPSETLTRNSRNFISVITLALYASAMLLSKPMKVTVSHLIGALFVLGIAIWATGRGGIVSALLLNLALFMHVVFRGRFGVVRSTIAVLLLLLISTAIFIGSESLQSQGYLSRLASRGLHDAPRLAMMVAYFQDIQPTELLLGKNYYDNAYLARFGFNLHNSYLSAWAHLGLMYLLFIIVALALSVKRIAASPAICIAVLAFALRALTDTQLLGGKYDYVVIGALFTLLRDRNLVWINELHQPSHLPIRRMREQGRVGEESDEPRTSGLSSRVPLQ